MDRENHEVLKYPLWYLNICGRNPYSSWKIYLFSASLYIISFLIFYTGVLVNFMYLDSNVILFVGNCEGLSVLLQIVGKVIVTTYLKNTFIEIIDIAREWKFEGRPDLVTTILDNTLYFQKLYGRSMMVCTSLVMITPLFNHQFPTGIWNIPNQETLYFIILAMQEVACPLYVISMVGIDCLFLALCMLLTVQFRLLNTHLTHLKVPEAFDKEENQRYLNELTRYIKYHDFLLQYAKLLTDTYSPIMLLEFLTICVTSFAEMYLVFKSDNTVHFLRGVLLFSSFMLELAFYCVAATITTTEASKTADAIYKSDWCSQHIPKLGNTLSIMINRAQHNIIFTAEGLTEMNLRTLITVTQFAWSVCTIMRGLHKSE